MTGPSAFALDLFGFDVYTFPPGAAGAKSFHDPLEGTETSTRDPPMPPPPPRAARSRTPICTRVKPATRNMLTIEARNSPRHAMSSIVSLMKPQSVPGRSRKTGLNWSKRQLTFVALSTGEVEACHVFFLPGAFLLISCSEFGATAHDDAHNAFMTLPPYTRTREGEAPQLGSGPKPCRQSF
jgi:hypothetical protein